MTQELKQYIGKEFWWMDSEGLIFTGKLEAVDEGKVKIDGVWHSRSLIMPLVIIEGDK